MFLLIICNLGGKLKQMGPFWRVNFWNNLPESTYKDEQTLRLTFGLGDLHCAIRASIISSPKFSLASNTSIIHSPALALMEALAWLRHFSIIGFSTGTIKEDTTSLDAFFRYASKQSRIFSSAPGFTSFKYGAAHFPECIWIVSLAQSTGKSTILRRSSSKASLRVAQALLTIRSSRGFPSSGFGYCVALGACSFSGENMPLLPPPIGSSSILNLLFIFLSIFYLSGCLCACLYIW